MSHTAHITKLCKCHTQLIQLSKHSTKKKEELYVPKGWHRWWLPSSATSVWSVLTEQQAHSHWHCHCSHCSRWQWECHCCIQNSEQCGHATCSYCNTHWNVLMYNNISKRMSYYVPDSWYNWQKPTHSDSKSESHWCTTNDEFLSDLMWYIAVQTECSHQTAQWWPLSEKSECTEQAAADQQRELNQHQHLQEWEQQHMHCKEWGPCELSALRYVPVWHLHCCCCRCCCCWACCTRVSADIFNQERFHIQKLWVKKLKKKEKEKLYVRWEVYNSLHWQINSSELLKKTTQAMKKISSANLTHTKRADMCQQTLTIIQQSFQRLKAQPWRKREGWCHKLNPY